MVSLSKSGTWRWTRHLALLALMCVFLFPAWTAFATGGYFVGAWVVPATWLWSATALLIFCAMVGLGINRRIDGLLIDNRNRVSLSKFQMTAWTIVILSAYVTAIITNLSGHMEEATHKGLDFAVDVPGSLLAVMGISFGSLVASPAILSLKADDDTAPGDQLSAAAERLDDPPAGVAAVGKLYTRQAPKAARWLDMLRGDEVSNAAYPDLGKVQQFLFTIIAIGTYMFQIWGALAVKGQINSLPDFYPNVAWMIGISHVGYLTYKAAPHGRSADTKTTAVNG